MRTLRFQVDADAAVRQGWQLAFVADLREVRADEPLLEVPGVVSVALRMAGADESKRELDARFGNYLNFPVEPGRCPVIEATLADDATPIGVPLGAVSPEGEPGLGAAHRVVVRRGAKAAWTLCVDGRAVDKNGLRGRVIAWSPDDAAAPSVRVASKRVGDVSLEVATDANAARDLSAHDACGEEARAVSRPIQFWTPDGFNTWVGDVVLGVFRGRLHVFYLYDRRHHGSKAGTGGHHFEHLSSADLAHWVEHPAAVGIDQWWQTLGTGTPFVWNGQFYLSYGLHTSRFMPKEETCEPAMQAYFDAHGRMGLFKFGELPGFPMGGTYAVSDDGVRFKPSGTLFHVAQNPTVYNRADGLLGCVNSYGGRHGMYVSDHVGGWRMFDPGIPIDGDCPCEFEWRGRHYLLQGFRYFAYNADGRVGGWEDWSRTGDDIYDGLSVPMVAAWGDRRIMAGWISHPQGWGGWLAFHELVWLGDGRLGVRWLPETPPPGEVRAYGLRAGESLSVRFRAAGGGAENDVELRVDAAEGRAQWADIAPDAAARRAMSQAEYNAATPDEIRERRAQPASAAHEYAVQNIRGLDRPYEVKVAAFFDRKSGCTLFDAEIAGVRAMFCRRAGAYDWSR